MTLAFQSILMLVLLVSGAVVVVPAVLQQSHPQPSPALRADLTSTGLWLVETPQGQWMIHGTPHSPHDVEQLLRRRAPRELVHYLPSDALPFGAVTRSLRWLRSLAPAAVVLELPPGSPPWQ